MSVSWKTMQTLPTHVQQQLTALYSDLFPLQVRCVLSDWLETLDWDNLDPENPQHEDFLLNNILPQMFAELKRKIATSSMEIKFHLTMYLQKMEGAYAQNACHLMRVVKRCLQEEANIVREFEMGISPIPAEDGFKPNPNALIDEKFEQLKNLRDELQHFLPNIKQEQEQLVLAYSSFKKQQESWAVNNYTYEQQAKVAKEKECAEAKVRQKVQNALRNRDFWLQKFESCWSLAKELLQKVLNEDLVQWKRDQQLAGNGNGTCLVERALPLLQDRCETLAGTLWMNLQQLQSFSAHCSEAPLGNSPNVRLAELNREVQQMLNQLIQSTFLIEKQPPQVMKTNTRFTATVRFLVGYKLNVHMSPPLVRVTIISEANAKAFLSSNGKTVESSGDILNSSGTLEYHSGTNQLIASFRNMQLKKIKRAEKKGTESVMDEKFALLFQSTFKIGNGDFTYTVHALSLPVVVIVHGNQEPHAWATVTWDNAFAPADRLPFVVPDKVAWKDVGQVLSTKFKSYVGRDLSADAQRFLAGKAFRNYGLSDYDNMLLSWAQFAKEALPDRNFTLWEWFYALLKVTKEHMRSLWNDGTILGFISRKQTEDLLLQCSPGTFLLRFSDTELGGVTIAWLGEGSDGTPEVYMLQPFTSRDFGIRGLADRISDLHNLVYLYPNTPKEQAFGKYYTRLNEQQPLANGYVKHALALTLPGMSNGSIDFPNTPPSNLGFNPHSPESNSYHDPGSVPSISNDYMPGGIGSSVPDDILDLVDSMDFDINDLENILNKPQQ